MQSICLTGSWETGVWGWGWGSGSGKGRGNFLPCLPFSFPFFASGTAAAFGQCALSGPLCNLESRAAAAGDFTAEGNAWSRSRRCLPRSLPPPLSGSPGGAAMVRITATARTIKTPGHQHSLHTRQPSRILDLDLKERFRQKELKKVSPLGVSLISLARELKLKSVKLFAQNSISGVLQGSRLRSKGSGLFPHPTPACSFEDTTLLTP